MTDQLADGLSRILHCSTALSLGGEFTLLEGILKHLDRKHFENFICCIRPAEGRERLLTRLGCPTFSLEVGSPNNIAAAVRGLRRVIRQHRIDLMHMGLSGTERDVFIASLVTGTPALATLTTSFDPGVYTRARGRLRTWKLKALQLTVSVLARMCDARFMALSNEIKRSAVKHMHLPEERIQVVYLGLEPQKFAVAESTHDSVSSLRAELNLESAYPVLISVGRLSLGKGHVDLIRAMPQILERFSEARLLLVGDGPQRVELELLCHRTGIQNRVMFLGHREDVTALLHASDLFVFTSRFEGLPHAVMEAMASGKPVVAFSIPALAELVEDEDTGFLVDPGDIPAFVRRVSDIASSPVLRESMGLRGQQIVGERFDIRRNIKRLEALYQQIFANRTPGVVQPPMPTIGPT